MSHEIFTSRLGERYVFEYIDADDGWRAYIRSQPSYRDRPTDDHSTHRYRDRQGHRFVCWTQPLRTLRDAKAVAHYWADCTDVYRILGIFPRRREGIAARIAGIIHHIS